MHDHGSPLGGPVERGLVLDVDAVQRERPVGQVRSRIQEGSDQAVRVRKERACYRKRDRAGNRVALGPRPADEGAGGGMGKQVHAGAR